MKEYAAVFEKTSNGWSACAPDLPGLGVAGATFSETEQLLREGIELHIEGMREDLGEMDVTTAAKRLHVSRTTLSRVLNCASGMSADMSLRLSDALGTHASFWYDLRAGYDMWQASHKKRPRIERFDVAA